MDANFFQAECEWLDFYFRAINLERLFRYFTIVCQSRVELTSYRLLQLNIGIACRLEPQKIDSCLKTFFEKLSPDLFRSKVTFALLLGVCRFAQHPIPSDLVVKYKKQLDSNASLKAFLKMGDAYTVAPEWVLPPYDEFVKNARDGHVIGFRDSVIKSEHDAIDYLTLFNMTGNKNFLDVFLPFMRGYRLCENDIEKTFVSQINSMLYERSKQVGQIAQFFNEATLGARKLVLSEQSIDVVNNTNTDSSDIVTDTNTISSDDQTITPPIVVQ